MPRSPRLEIVGLPHHVAQRGVDRQAVSCEDQRSFRAYWPPVGGTIQGERSEP